MHCQFKWQRRERSQPGYICGFMRITQVTACVLFVLDFEKILLDTGTKSTGLFFFFGVSVKCSSVADWWYHSRESRRVLAGQSSFFTIWPSFKNNHRFHTNLIIQPKFWPEFSIMTFHIRFKRRCLSIQLSVYYRMLMWCVKWIT